MNHLWNIVFGLQILLVVSAHDGSTDLFLRRRNLVSSSEENVICRVTTFHQLYPSDDGKFQSKDAIHCIPIIDDDTEADDLFPLNLPESLINSYQREIAQGKLLVSISDAWLVNDELHIGNRAEYTIVEDDMKYRHLKERHLQSTNQQVTVAVIRISTPSEAPPVSVDTLNSTLFGSDGFQKQYSDCSFGQLTIVNNGVYDVQISQTTAELGNDWSRVIAEAQNQIKMDRNLTLVQSLADKVLMCVPPGTGDWAASADMNSWRAQFNADWCTSLSATMHEVGHLFGLLHAQKDWVEYDDYTGYMSASYKDADWPKKCFNGENANQLGWYSDKQKKIDPLVDGGALVELASFVDYPKASNAYVNIAISDRYYLQYNVAEGINVDTQDMANQVTITEAYSNGSNLIAGLEPGAEATITNFDSSGRNLVIRACGSGMKTSGAKTMLMSIAFDTSLCDNYQGEVEYTVADNGGGCFSDRNSVEVRGKGIVPINSIQIGDFVRVANDQFSQVYSFGHLDRNMEVKYLQLYSGNELDTPLEVTSDHMVYVSTGQVVRASEIRVGDQLLGMINPVVKIGSVYRRGVYAPVTFAGDIVVNGVVASSYVSLLEKIPSPIMNAASHVTMGLHRMVCTLDFDRCLNETYTTDGINEWIANVVSVITFVNHQCVFLQMAVLILFLPLIMIIFLVENWFFVLPMIVGSWMMRMQTRTMPVILKFCNKFSKTNDTL